MKALALLACAVAIAAAANRPAVHQWQQSQARALCAQVALTNSDLERAVACSDSSTKVVP